MALDTLITGTNLDAGGNVKTALTNTAAYIGGVRMFSENDAGDVLLVPYLKSPETSNDYRLRVGSDTSLFNDTFNGATQNTNNWAYTFVTLTASQPGAGTVNFGTVQGTAGTHGAFMRTFQYFPIIGTAPLWHESEWGMFTAPLTANEVWSCGMGLPGGAVTLPTEGVWFQLTTAGLIGRTCYSGAFTDSGVLKAFGDFSVGEIYKFSIMVAEDEVEWWVDDVLVGTTVTPAGQGQPMQPASLPAFMMKHCTGVVANTNTMRLSDIIITLADMTINKPWSHQLSGMGGNASIGQNGQTQGKTSWWTNNTAPTAAAATNTTVIAGATTLGGLVAVLPTLAVNSDGILFSFQNPTSTATTTGKNLYVTGTKVQGAVSVVLSGGPVVYAYGMAFGHTAVSLATTETGSFITATTHSPRVKFIGFESYAAAATVGAVGGGVTLDFETPVTVRPGEFVSLIARNIGAATTTGAITVGCTFKGYWE